MVSPWIRIGNLLHRSALFLQKAFDCVERESRRDELRRVASKSASEYQKKDDAAHAQQSSHSSTDDRQWQADLEAQSIWSTRESRVIAGLKSYLDKGDDMKVEIEALELLMDPEGSEVDLLYIRTYARKRSSRIFEIFRTKEKIDHLVAN